MENGLDRDQLGRDCSVYETSCVSKVRGWECGEGSGGKRHQEGTCGPRVLVLDVWYVKELGFQGDSQVSGLSDLGGCHPQRQRIEIEGQHPGGDTENIRQKERI